ncbi:MAG: hypothetical protein OHK0022_29710 [Roseiflexaceae bacterium]
MPLLSLIRQNTPLALGLALSGLMLLLALFGPALAPRDPLEQTKLIEIGGVFYGTPPISRAVPPFTTDRYPLGTDRDMRDLLSLLLWAVRPTLLLCAAVAAARLLIGVPLGVLAGWFGGRTAALLDAVIGITSAVPALAFALAALVALGIQGGLLVFVVALTLNGWCDTAQLARTRTRLILNAPYIESARSVGLSPARILWAHVLPQVLPLLPLLAAFEMSATLLLVAELGYLGYFIGGGYLYTYSTGNFDTQFVLISNVPELGQMLSGFFSQLYTTPWVPLFAGLMIFLALAGFALLGEGLRRRLDITRPRRVWSFWRRDAAAVPVTPAKTRA